MKTIFFSMLVAVFMLMSCKKESEKTSSNSDTIAIPDTVDKIPVPNPIDTLVATSESDTLSIKNDSAKMTK